MAERPHVVVIGAGFGGLRVVKGLPRAAADVTVIDPNNFHTFQPLLYQVASMPSRESNRLASKPSSSSWPRSGLRSGFPRNSGLTPGWPPPIVTA